MTHEARLNLLHQLTKMKEYLEDRFEDITEAQARGAVFKINEAWHIVERRKP